MAQGPDEVVTSPVDEGEAIAAAETDEAESSDEIRSQIAQTRTEIGDTLDAIQARLSPSRVMADVRESVAEATMGRMAGLPVALLMMAGTGAACWLLWRAWARPTPARHRESSMIDPRGRAQFAESYDSSM
jgi:hypothetical protein